MVKITNGRDVLNVPKGAFEMMYKDIGFKVVGEAERAVIEEHVQHVEDESNNDDDSFVEEMLEKPISEWDKNELKRFAKVNGIEIPRGTTLAEVRNIIKEFMENS